jgi:hypothetical protein
VREHEPDVFCIGRIDTRCVLKLAAATLRATAAGFVLPQDAARLILDALFSDVAKQSGQVT